MGQSHSKAPSHHAQSHTSRDADPSQTPRPNPTSTSSWIKLPRSRFTGKNRHDVSSNNVVPQTYRRFIPKQQYQRSVGPIRSRPEPSEYGLRREPPPSSSLPPTVRIQEHRSSRAIPIEGQKQRRVPVDVVGMAIDSSSTTPSRSFGGGLDTGNLSQSSFTSLAPPVPPSPVPPLRKQRRPSAQAVTRQDRSDSADSSFTVSLADIKNGSSTQNLQQNLAAGQLVPPASAATVSAGAGTVPSSMGTLSAVGESSTAATSVNATSTSQPTPARKGAGGSPVHLTLSPALTASGRLSEASDSGTKEILLSDRDSSAGPKMSSDSFIRGPFDEQHPDLHSFYPAGTALTRPIGYTVPTTVPSPLSRMTELRAESPPPRHVGAVPDLSARPASGQYESLGRGRGTVHGQLDSATESFRSVRSFRSTSDGNVRPYRPLPAVPVRSRGYSVGLATDRSDPSYGEESYVTADADIVDQPVAQRIDGLPVSDTQHPPFMGMGMVAAATPPTQYTHSSHDQSATGDDRCGRRFSRTSRGSLVSPISGPRPLPSIPSKPVDTAVESAHAQWKGKKQKN